MKSLRLAALLALFIPGAAPAQTQQDGNAVASHDPKTWDVPYGARSRPRDPYADTQGRVWFVGQSGNYIAYMDSRTGQFRQFAIDSGTHPHNLGSRRGRCGSRGTATTAS